MMCAEAAPLLHAQFDGELDVATSLRMEQHLAGCGSCSAQYKELQKLREELSAADLDWTAETDLRRLRRRIEASQRPVWRSASWVGLAAMLAGVAFLAGTWVRPGGDIDREVVDGHVRSLMSGHVVDVPSSDRHTVKPWFQGKVDFAPPTPDLSAAGFELTGGRLEEVAGRRAAAIVYRRGAHVINLFVVHGVLPVRGFETMNGYHVASWQSQDMTFWAASDVDATTLRQFCDLVRKSN